MAVLAACFWLSLSGKFAVYVQGQLLTPQVHIHPVRNQLHVGDGHMAPHIVPFHSIRRPFR
jgi:hypothetical protein